MYLLLILMVFVIALAILFSPLLAVILFVLAVAGIGGAKFFGGGSVVDQETSNATQGQADVPTPPASPASEERKGGIWGEVWPQEREEERNS